SSSSKNQSNEAPIALQNLVESSTSSPISLGRILIVAQADIWSMPSRSRVHAAIGKQESKGPNLGARESGYKTCCQSSVAQHELLRQG
ncbi:hypothetical protein EV421DRAFT_1717125, partial [Armillaria borealis]